MGEKWQVVVSRWTEDDGWIEEAQLIAPREALARFAPGVVAEALGVQPALESLSPDNSTGTFTPAVEDSRTERVSAGVVESVRRKRRTKAQIAADEAAALLEAQTAAEVAVTNAGPDPYPDADAVPNGNEAPAGPFNPFAPK